MKSKLKEAFFKSCGCNNYRPVIAALVEAVEILQKQFRLPGPRGEKGDTGPAGHTPTDSELEALISPIVASQLGVVENGYY